ncbi:MAG: M23 family metallopeptidase [Oscillospiraceae bacterium]|nr:M23 family metallopeptidase [Oscillospiraceae bacterium]
MNRETEVAESVSEAFSGGSFKERRIHDFFVGIFSVLFELFSLLKRKAVNLSVIFATWFNARVLMPLSIFLAATANVAARASWTAFYKIRCLSHRAVVVMQNFRANRLALAVSMMATLFIAIVASTYSVGVKITVDGKVLGYANNREDFEKALTFVEDRASEILERPYSVTSNIRFEVGLIENDEIISNEVVYDYFFSRIDEISTLYAITVDGEVVGASRNRETLQDMIDKLLYVNDSAVHAKFSKNVEIIQTEVDSSKLISYDEIREKLLSRIHSTKEYTVRPGDTLEAIAKENGIAVQDLKKLNPGAENVSLRVGEVLTIAKEVPFLSIEAVRRVEYTETIPFETKNVNDDTLYKGTTKVVTKGQAGERAVVADVTYIDNKEDSREIISSTITKEPITKVIHIGTKARPKKTTVSESESESKSSSKSSSGSGKGATGRLSRPVSGAIISSNYGMRRGSMHKGVDFAARSGTRISAADGGTVTWAGWKSGGWGYLVVINHGNGLETYYAHNSKVTVSVGQKVSKGQQIAKMGSTGNSTGPHVHFEIHKNGQYVNPWRYIS